MDKLQESFHPAWGSVDMRALRVSSPIKEKDHRGIMRKRKMGEMSRFYWKLRMLWAFQEKCLLSYQLSHFSKRG